MLFPALEIEIVGMPAAPPVVTTITELLALPEDGMRPDVFVVERQPGVGRFCP